MKPKFAAILKNGNRYVLNKDHVRDGSSSDTLLSDANHFLAKIESDEAFYQGVSENGNAVTFRGTSVIAIEIVVDYKP